MASSSDDEWAVMIAWYAGLSDVDPVKYEFKAYLYTVQARAAWRTADRLRLTQARKQGRQNRIQGQSGGVS